MKLPEIKTKRLLMRMYRSDELEEVFDLCTDPDIIKYFPDYYSVDREKVLSSLPRRIDRWREPGYGQLGVFDKDSKKLLGYCGLQPLDNTGEVELYYGFFKKNWGKGLATEAAKAFLRFGFENLKLDKIVAVTHPENVESQKVLKKLGMKQGENGIFYSIEASYFYFLLQNYKPDGDAYEVSFEKIDGNVE